MRYREFVTAEALDRFMSHLLGTPTSSSWEMPKADTSTDSEPSNTSSTTDKPTTDKPTTDKPTTMSSGEILPVNGPISSPYGRRSDGMHYGTDFAVPTGTPVKAPQAGIVSRTGSDNMNGTFVEINSNGTIHSLLHLSKSNVTNGQQVKRGEVVGLSGNTGNSRGPHLHWSKRVAGRPVDPMANVG